MSLTQVSEQKLERIAVIVTHGVGEAEPGQSTASLVHVLGDEPGVVLEEAAEVLLLPDRTNSTHFSNHKIKESNTEPGATFPVLLRQATIQDRVHLTFAELYWADLTRVGSGRIASLLGLFRVIFEAHYVIDAMLDPRRGWAVRGLRFVLLWLSWLMRGPIAGVTVSTAAVFWAALYLRPQGWSEHLQPQYLFAGVLSVVFLLSMGLRIWSETRWDATWRTSLNWTLIMSGFFAGVVLTAPSALSHTLYHPLNFGLTVLKNLAPSFYENYLIDPSVTQFPAFAKRADFVNLHYRNLIRLWIVFSTVWLCGALPMLSLIGICAWSRKSSRSIFAPALAATGILTLQLALWTALVGTAVLPLLNRAQEIIAITTLRPAVMAVQDVDGDNPLLKVDEVKRLLDVDAFLKVDYDWVPRLVFAYGFNGMIVIAIILIGGCVFFIRTRMATRVRGASTDVLTATAQKLPRMLFSWPVLAVLIVLTLIQLTFHIMFAAATQKNAFADAALHFLSYFIDAESIKWLKLASDSQFAYYLNGTMFLAWLLAFVFPLLMGKGFNNAVHIARDLIDHQFGPHRGRVLAQRRDRRLPDSVRWPRRERIRQRLLQLLAALAKRGGCDKVIFLAHSQGSVVIYDYLKADADYANNEVRGTKPFVITCGSPLTHLYQQYFREYAGLEPSLERLSRCTSRWINLYRVDDYIGLWVGDIDGGIVENCPLDPGGHLDYWRERTLVKAILAIVAENSTMTPVAI